MSLGSNIKKIRESKNISIDEMVKRIWAISKLSSLIVKKYKKIYIDIERGLSPTNSLKSSGLLNKISIALGVTPNEIINYKENNSSKQVLDNLDIKNLKDIVASVDISKKPKDPVLIFTPVTNTPINVVLEDLSIKEVVYKKPILLTSSELFQLGDRIKTVGVKDTLPTEILIDSFGELDPNLIVDKKRSFSSRLLNWIEPYVINGVEKTLFYTEINTGLKVGDRVFIINGSYDSNKFLQENKYKRKVDGYLVLFVDNCKVALDIDYESDRLPFIDESIDNFINIYYIERRGDFIQANRQVTSRGGEFGYKFGKNQNNIAFFNSPFNSITSEWGNTSGINTRGFYVKDDDNTWKDITNYIITGSFSDALSEVYTNNDKIKIHNGSFTFSIGSNVVSFVDGLIYEWKLLEELDGVLGTASSWIVDNNYNTPFISKSNFRKGDFNGIFNSGVFGTQERRITWDKDTFTNATWNTGVLLNTNWISGNMKSINALPESYVSEFDENGIPYQKFNAPNNNGRGFNYIENSIFTSIEIENGIFNTSNIGQSVTYSIMEEYVTGSTSSVYNFTINKAILDKCNIVGGLVKDTDVINSRVLNTKLENIKSINSNYKLSIIKDSVYISDNIIKILAYDEFTISEITSITGHSHKIYKFYISESDYKKLKIRDRFYINGLSIRDNSRYPLNFFDRRFRLSSWTEYFDSYKNNQFIKKGVEVGAFLSTPGDNEWKLNYIINPQVKTVVTEENQNSQYYSLDIVVSTYDKQGDLLEPDGVTNELPIGGLTINKDYSASILGTGDSSFKIGVGFDNSVNVTKVDSLGRILVGGSFSSYRGVTANKIIRLNSDGSIDNTFNTGIGFDGEVFDIKIDNNGKILVGGLFNGYNTTSSRRMIRLNPNGSVDLTFNFDAPGNSEKVRTIEIDNENRILVGGFFNRYNGIVLGNSGNCNIIRLNEDGSIDTTFLVGEGFQSTNSESVNILKVDSGKILVGGRFPSYQNINNTGLLVRLNEDGSLDSSFNNTLIYNSTDFVNDIERQEDKIIIVGRLFNSYTGNNIYRLNDDGSLDNTFNAPIFTHTSTSSNIQSVKIYENKIYVVGLFNQVSGVFKYGLERLNPNGTVDTLFNNNNRFDLNSNTLNLDIDQLGRIYVVGSFTQYNNQQYIGIVRIKLSYSEPNIIGDNIDISSAYIVNSDFESGIIENTDWIGGNHINYNNDVNIVSDSGTYSIIAITQSSQLLVRTGYDSSYKESGDDCLEVDNVVFLGNIEYQSPNGSIIKLGDTYKIVESFGSGDQLRLEELGTNTISSITQSGGTFSTADAQNRYNYIYKAKIDKSKISSGIFRRSYITGSFIENEKFDISDKDFNNLTLLKQLVISDSIFKDNSNILSKGLYMNSSFVNGDDRFENGIVYKSIWNGLTFSRGLFKESRWVNGTFNSGLFYNNRSFDGITSSSAPFFNNERVKSYYKDGVTSTTQSNDRYSWQNGNFNNGDLFESDWENGEFNGGKFYYSKFYNGNINGGVVGDKSIPLTSTIIHNGVINFTTVENAAVFASNNSSGLTSSIVWKDGIFNGGEFGSNDNHIAIWENGQFNSGNFENMGIWKNGTFNGGRFLSTYGWTMSDSITQSNYTWQDGTFNGGEFGNANGASNSTWFTGEFNGGKFVGRVWNNGIFTNGDFIGSATHSSIRGVTATQSNAFLFTESFTYSYYGLWRDGVVSDKKDDFIKDRQIITPIIRVKSRKESLNTIMSNSLWLNGTFSHSSGLIQNSVWLNGIFERGRFFNSSFNPYVNRNGSTQSSFELSDSCRWVNGELLDSDFYISKWEKGKFDTGDAYGMIWKDGVCNYMNAFNIFWEKGLWRNGNWYGSYINYNGSIEDDFNKQILLRGVSWSGTQSMHIWNIFDDPQPATDFSSASASALTQFSFNVGFISNNQGGSTS